MIKSFKTLFINIVLLFTMLLSVAFTGFNICEIKNITESDGAVLARFFAVTDLTLNFTSDIFQFNKVSDSQTKQSSKNVFGTFNDLMLNTKYYGQVLSSCYFLFVVSIFYIFIYFVFKNSFIRYLWRCIVVNFLSKILFSLLPRSVSIKTLLLNNIALCFLF